MAETREQRGWERLRAWWEEYYMDNPAVWLLASSRPFTPSEDGATNSRSQVAQPAWRISAPWHLSRTDRWLAVGWWLVCLLTITILIPTGWHRLLLTSSGAAAFAMVFLAGGLIAGFVGMGWYRSAWIVHTLVDPMQGLYMGLTRLCGTHIVYGALTYIACSVLRGLLLFGLPILWLLGFVIIDSLWLGLRFALVSALYLVVLAFFLGVVGALMGAARKKTQPSSHSNDLSPLLWGTLMPALMAVHFLGMRLWLTASGITVPPIWQWYTLPLWWISLVPPLLPFTLLLVHHPLWGFPQIGIALLLGLLLLPHAVRRVEQARLRHEPEPIPDEGDW